MARRGSESAKELFARLWVSSADRQAVAFQLGMSIRYANQCKPASWSLTLRGDIDRVRLNVGQALVVDCERESVNLYYAKSPLLRIRAPFVDQEPRRRSWFKKRTVPIPVGLVCAPVRTVSRISPTLEACHFKAIQAAAAAKPHSPFRNAMSLDALAYLEGILHTKLPRPTYVEDIKEGQGADAGANGAGFGDPETNAAIEEAAIKAVTARYEAAGWTVMSREGDCCGYDLQCKMGRQRKHVEVKGIRGSRLSFFMTRQEVARADEDNKFVLAVVRDALSKAPKFHEWKGSDFHGSFSIDPTVYRVVGRG